MPLVDYDSSESEHETESPEVKKEALPTPSTHMGPLGSKIKPMFDGKVTASGRAVEIQKTEIAPASRTKTEKEVDLAVLMRIQARGTIKSVATRKEGPESSAAVSQPAPEPATEQAAKPAAAQDQLEPLKSLKRPNLAPDVATQVVSGAHTESADPDERVSKIQKIEEFNAQQVYDQSPLVQDSEPLQVHAIASGKHQLKSLIRNAQENQEALQETFAKNRQSRKDARNRYAF